MNAELLRPELLWLAPVFAAVMLALAAFGRQPLSAALLRLLSLSLIALALASPIKRRSQSTSELTAVFDLSYSVTPEGRKALADSLRPYLEDRHDAALTLIPFGREAKEPIRIDRPDEEHLQKALEEGASEVDTGETDLASGINKALSQSASSSLIVASDGFETRGDAREAAQSAAGQKVKLFPVVPPDSAFLAQALTIAGIDAPITVNAGDAVEIRVGLKNTASDQQSGSLEVWLNEQKIYSNDAAVPAAQERLILAKTPPTKGGLQRIRAVLKSSDGKQQERHRWISVKERLKIVLVSGTEDDGQVLRQLLNLKGYPLEAVVADGRNEVPINFENVGAVILNNVARRQLPPQFLSNLREFVAVGGGALLVGGDRSFGLGDYIGTQLEEISPLKFVPPQTTKRRLNNAVVLLIDKSRSMAYEGKIEAAKGAAVAAIQALKEDDQIGVTGFDTAPFVIIRLAPVSEVKKEAERRLRNLTAAGGTNMLPGLASARQELSNSTAGRKHVIILSDGKVAEAGAQYIQEVNRLVGAGVTVSAVAVGIEADGPFLKMLADYGRGAFYQTLDPSQLPQIFLHDIRVATGEKTMKEQQDFPVDEGTAGLRSSGVSPDLPIVRGFVETQFKPGAEQELVTRKEDKQFPILASWSFQKGKVAAFTSDANGRWSLPWLRWAGFAKFWSDLVESVKNRAETKGGEVNFDLRYSIDQRRVMLDLAVYDEKLREQAAPLITGGVIEPGGESKALSFEAVKKGRFVSQLEGARPGDYKLSINYGRTKFPPLALTIPGDAFGERQGLGINRQLLDDLAKISGGKVNPGRAEVQGENKKTEEVEHLSLSLLIAAFLLVLLEAFVRELGLAALLLGLLRRTPSPKTEAKSKIRGQYGRRRKAA